MIKKNVIYIPEKLETYVKAPEQNDINSNTIIKYVNLEKQQISVVSWIRYPSYDLIFGVPDKGKRHKHEIGFFEYRFKNIEGKEKRLSLYVDINECKEIIEGFKLILEKSKSNSSNLWKEYEKSRSTK